MHVLAILKKTQRKRLCRSSNKKLQSASSIDKRPKTLESSRKERFGIGNKSTKVDAEKYGRGKRRRGQTVDYRKLNEGDEGCCDMSQNDTIGKIELIPAFVLSKNKTNC